MEQRSSYFPVQTSESMTHSQVALAKELLRQLQDGEASIFELPDDAIRLLQRYSPDGRLEIEHAA